MKNNTDTTASCASDSVRRPPLSHSAAACLDTPPGALSPGSGPMIIVDAHEDTLLRLAHGGDLISPRPNAQSDIPKWKAGGVNVVFTAIWMDPFKIFGTDAEWAVMDFMSILRQQARNHADQIALCETAAQVRDTVAGNRIALVPAIEGGVAISNDLTLIARYRSMGVRYITLTWKDNLPWVGGSETDKPERGLSEFGRQVVTEMNRVGMIIDMSHASDRSFWDVVEVSTKPVICSHSNARALAGHVRNVSDEMLAALGKNGGVIGVNIHQGFLDKQGHVPKATEQLGIGAVIGQIEHIVRVAGIDHVGIGTDWDGGIKPVVGMENASGMRTLISALREHGYDETSLRKIAGGNFLRVLEQNEQGAR